MSGSNVFCISISYSIDFYFCSVATSYIGQGTDELNIAQNKSNRTMKDIRAAGTL